MVYNDQHHHHESLELKPVPASISDEDLEANISKTLSLTGHNVNPENLQACHHLKKRRLSLNLNVENRNQEPLLTGRTSTISQMFSHNFSGKLFISENMCHENHHLAYKFRQFKKAGKIHSMWFWNNSINVKLGESGQPIKIDHIIDIGKLLDIDNLDEFINNTFNYLDF